MGERSGEVTQKCYLFSVRKPSNYKITRLMVNSAILYW